MTRLFKVNKRKFWSSIFIAALLLSMFVVFEKFSATVKAGNTGSPVLSTIWHISDNHGSIVPQCMQNLINSGPQSNVLVVDTGDIGDTPVESQYLTVKSSLNNLTVPWIVMRGNHDAGNDTAWDDVFGANSTGVEYYLLGTKYIVIYFDFPLSFSTFSLATVTSYVNAYPSRQIILADHNFALDTTWLGDYGLDTVLYNDTILMLAGHFHTFSQTFYAGENGSMIPCYVTTAIGDSNGGCGNDIQELQLTATYINSTLIDSSTGTVLRQDITPIGAGNGDISWSGNTVTRIASVTGPSAFNLNYGRIQTVNLPNTKIVAYGSNGLFEYDGSGNYLGQLTSSSVITVACGDLDGDGQNELAVTNGTYITVYNQYLNAVKLTIDLSSIASAQAPLPIHSMLINDVYNGNAGNELVVGATGNTTASKYQFLPRVLIYDSFGNLLVNDTYTISTVATDTVALAFGNINGSGLTSDGLFVSAYYNTVHVYDSSMNQVKSFSWSTRAYGTPQMEIMDAYGTGINELWTTSCDDSSPSLKENNGWGVTALNNVSDTVISWLIHSSFDSNTILGKWLNFAVWSDNTYAFAVGKVGPNNDVDVVFNGLLYDTNTGFVSSIPVGAYVYADVNGDGCNELLCVDGSGFLKTYSVTPQYATNSVAIDNLCLYNNAVPSMNSTQATLKNISYSSQILNMTFSGTGTKSVTINCSSLGSPSIVNYGNGTVISHTYVSGIDSFNIVFSSDEIILADWAIAHATASPSPSPTASPSPSPTVPEFSSQALILVVVVMVAVTFCAAALAIKKSTRTNFDSKQATK